LQAVLGLFNFNLIFVPRAVQMLQSLTDALGSSLVLWNAERREVFKAAKEALADTALLDHPSGEAELSLVTDMSGYHLGAALQQRHSGQAWWPIGF
jgi:hypothetical protein